MPDYLAHLAHPLHLIHAMPTTSPATPALRLATRYRQVRDQTVALCAPLAPEDQVVQPHPDVSPPKWHLGHSTWFFENFILVPHQASYTPFDLRLNWFFNSYYESQGERIVRSQRGNMSRPTVATILAYRQHVDQAMRALFAATEREHLSAGLLQLVEVGLQHEQQHQELLVTDIKYILGHNPLYPAYRTAAEGAAVPNTARTLGFLPVAAGNYEVGYSGEDFCWDNEQSRHTVYLHDFEIGDRLVTNAEYLAFMEAGGYADHRYWLSPGWEWAKALETAAPLYWYRRDGQWLRYGPEGLRALNPAAPVTHLSYYEADAFAAWRGMRLPTEFEWEVACQQYGNAPAKGNFLESGQLDARACCADSTQFLGDCWEWTASAYLPYPNYPRFKGALGEYNGKFMVNQMVLRGGSCATPVSHIRPTYRNFFPTDMRWQFVGLRLAR